MYADYSKQISANRENGSSDGKMDFCDDCGTVIEATQKCCIKDISKTSTDRQEKEESLPQEILGKWQKEQDELKKRLVLEDTDVIKEMMAVGDDGKKDYYIGGVDISFVKGDDVNACAGLVVVTYPKLELVYEDYIMVELTAPYIPGFLAFREVDFLVQLHNKLKDTQPQYLPDVIFVDGNGILHPRMFGVGCHLGVLLDIPCLGVAKNLHCVDGLLRDEKHLKKIDALERGGDSFPLIGDSGTLLGMALKSGDTVKCPVYVSAGHKITQQSALKLVYRCCKYRIPEPTRLADINSREYLRVNFLPKDINAGKQGKKKSKPKEINFKIQKTDQETKRKSSPDTDIPEDFLSFMDNATVQ